MYKASLKNNEPKALGCKGGPPLQVVRRCLRRMKNWATLALATVRAEFPHFEILQTFNIFHIPASPAGCNNADVRESMQAKQRDHCMVMASCLRWMAMHCSPSCRTTPR